MSSDLPPEPHFTSRERRALRQRQAQRAAERAAGAEIERSMDDLVASMQTGVVPSRQRVPATMPSAAEPEAYVDDGSPPRAGDVYKHAELGVIVLAGKHPCGKWQARAYPGVGRKVLLERNPVWRRVARPA